MQSIDQTGGTALDAAKTHMDEEAEFQAVFAQILENFAVPISEEAVEEELNLEIGSFIQTMRYRAMGGDHQLEEMDFEEWKADTRKEIIRDHQEEAILNSVIEKEHLTVSPKELEAAAADLARRNDTTLEMVRGFLGEDYALLKKETLYQKAKRFLVQNSYRDECGDGADKNHF